MRRLLLLSLLFASNAFGAIAFETSGIQSASATSSITCTPGATPADDSIIYFGLAWTGNTTTKPTSYTPPSGFTEYANSDATSDFSELTIWYKVASSESGGYTTSWTGGSNYTSSCFVVSYTGADTGTIHGTPVNTQDTSSNTTFDIPALTTSYNNSYDLAVVSHFGNITTCTLSSWGGSLTERIDNDSGDFSNIGMGEAARATAGAQSATSTTCTNSDESHAIRWELIEDGAIGGIIPLINSQKRRRIL